MSISALDTAKSSVSACSFLSSSTFVSCEGMYAVTDLRADGLLEICCLTS